jgi:DNA-directed RNA polymerase subunit RPC12/RpoP
MLEYICEDCGFEGLMEIAEIQYRIKHGETLTCEACESENLIFDEQ